MATPFLAATRVSFRRMREHHDPQTHVKAWQPDHAAQLASVVVPYGLDSSMLIRRRLHELVFARPVDEAGPGIELLHLEYVDLLQDERVLAQLVQLAFQVHLGNTEQAEMLAAQYFNTDTARS